MKRAYTLVEILIVMVVVSIVSGLLLTAFFTVREKQKQTICLTNLRELGMAFSLYRSDYDGAFPPTVSGINQREIDTVDGPIWLATLSSYLKNSSLSCPAVYRPGKMAGRTAPVFCGYAYNSFLGDIALSRHTKPPDGWIQGQQEFVLQYPSLTVTVADARAGLIAIPAPDFRKGEGFTLLTFHIKGFQEELDLQTVGAKRHTGGANYLFADNHVKWLHTNNFNLQKADGQRPSFWP